MVSPSLLPLLRCPVTGSRLRAIPPSIPDTQATLLSETGIAYPVVHGVPVLLPLDDDPTLWVASASYRAARENRTGQLYEDTIGITPEQLVELRARLDAPVEADSRIDPLISFLVCATCGFMYREQIGRLAYVPIPEIRLPPGDGLLLDIGCNWGRWSVAAGRRGYHPIGIDPSLGGVLAAKRLCDKQGIAADFVVADARHMPFGEKTFDVVFSYSVLQHFSFENAERAVAEMARVAKPHARLLVQMPNKFGIRCLYQQVRRRFRPAREFEVRHYSPGHLRKLFAPFGPAELEADCYFGLAIQPSDRRLLPAHKRLVIDCSEALRKGAGWLPPLKYLADSLYVMARRSLS